MLAALVLLQPTRETPVPPPPPPAFDYRVEYAGGGRGWICDARGGRWPIDNFHGETTRLEVGWLPGIGRQFLILHALSGAYTYRLIAFEVHPDGSLTPCADGWTCDEFGQNETLIEGAFGDVDGDGREEFIEWDRRWIFDERVGMIANWAPCTISHAWTGERFEPRFIQLSGAGVESPTLLIESGDVEGAYSRALEFVMHGWYDAGRDLMRDLAAPERAETAFRDLMNRNNVGETPYFDRYHEVVPVCFTGPAESALLVSGSRMGGGAIYVFDDIGRLLHRAPTHGLARDARAVDLDGDGLDEIVFAGSGGGTGLHYDFEHVFTAQGGRPREILSIDTSGYDVNYCGNELLDGHNWQSATSLDYAPADADGTVRLRATTIVEHPCECDDAAKPPPPPPTRTVEVLIWRRGGDRFETEPP